HRGGKPLNPSSGTFTANPIGLTAGLAAMKLLTPESFDRLEALGERARDGIAKALNDTGFPGQVTGVGSMFQIHATTRPITDYRSARATPAETAVIRRIQKDMLTRGFILSGKASGFISTAMSENDIDAFSAALADSLRLAKAY